MTWIVHEALVLLVVNATLWLWLWAVPTVVWEGGPVPFGAKGVALPGLVILRRGAAPHVLAHELIHQDQLRRWSPLGAALKLGWHYGAGFLRRREVSRSVFMELYHRNPLEREAFEGMWRPLPRRRLWRV